MKNKINILVVALLVCITTLFAGCTKADKATVSDITSKFNTEIQSYLTTKEQLGSAIISKENSDNYYFLFNPQDNADLAQRINNSSMTIYSILKTGEANGAEYDYLLTHSSKYFNNKFMNSDYMLSFKDSYGSIPQAKLTKLWNSVDSSIKEIKSFGEKYRQLSNSFDKDNLQSINATYALEDLLKEYKKLIGSVLKMNLDAQDILDNSLFTFSDLKDKTVDGVSVPATVPSVEVTRMVDAFELYTMEYLYQRYMAFDTNTQVNFKQNSLVKAMQQLIDAVKNKADGVADSSKVDLYRYLRLAEKSMNSKIEANRNAVKVLNGKVPTSTDKDFEYKNLVYQDLVSFEQTLIGYINNLLSIIND